MGDWNQYTLIENMVDDLDGPFLEIGSKDYGSTQDLRTLLGAKGRYVGIDMEQGAGVDLVLDLTLDFSEIDAALEGERFGTIVCLSVLEHCDQPFRMAENMTRLLKPGGKVVVCAPFAWKFHGYPSDYWRFTHEGIKKLFPQLTFDMDHSFAASARDGEFKKLDEQIGRATFATRPHWDEGRYVRGVVAKGLRMLGNIGIFSWLTGYRYVMIPTNVFMTGTLKSESQTRAA
jgi:SAM-dependent methyltransferase